MKISQLPRSAIAAFAARHAHLIALALFAAIGVAVLDDYGVGSDESIQRKIGEDFFHYIAGDEYALMSPGHHGRHSDRYYGVAFELPLIVAERVFRLEDSRSIHLSRHIITHLLFLAAGFSASFRAASATAPMPPAQGSR